MLLIVQGLPGSLSVSLRAEVSLCFREGALKTQNVTAEYYDLKAACVVNKADGGVLLHGMPLWKVSASASWLAI